MYLTFYRLNQAPFHITPDPAFLFLSPSHKAALGSIIYGIEERQGFVAITGEVGLGKTTILRSYLERVDPKQLRTIYIFNANVSFKNLLVAIYGEFGREFTTDDLFEMVNQLHQALIDEYQRGRNVALIIDEAQNMPIETLENLRMLSNLETATQKLVQIVLIGQPEFEKKLNLHELRQLKQRLVIRSILAPLTAEESVSYVQYRLAKVAATDEPIFTRGALKLLVHTAQGTPRVLNILCTNALITGFGYQQKPISSRTVKEVIADFQGKKHLAPRPRRLKYAAAAALCVGLLWLSPYRDAVLEKIPDLAALQRSLAPAGSLTPDSTRETRFVDSTPRAQHMLPALAAQSLGITHTPTEHTTPTITHDIIAPGNDSRAPQSLWKTIGDRQKIDEWATEEPAKKIPTTGVDNPVVAENVEKYTLPFVASMGKGDYVSKLAVEIYGFSNRDILQWIMAHNPHIKDINRVEVGEKILFPTLSSTIE